MMNLNRTLLVYGGQQKTVLGMSLHLYGRFIAAHTSRHNTKGQKIESTNHQSQPIHRKQFTGRNSRHPYMVHRSSLFSQWYLRVGMKSSFCGRAGGGGGGGGGGESITCLTVWESTSTESLSLGISQHTLWNSGQIVRWNLIKYKKEYCNLPCPTMKI